MRKLYTVLLLLIFLGAGFVSVAQQDPQFSQNMFTKLAVNPGFAGANGGYCATLLYRNQWTGFGGEPKTMLLTADADLDVIHGGAGLTVISDRLGVDNILMARLAYAFRADLGDGKIGIGVDFGLKQQSEDGGKLISNDQGDPNIPTGKVSGNSFDMGLGVYYNTEKLYVGASASHLTEGDIKYGNITSKNVRHYYLQAGYGIDLTSSLTLKPCVLVKTDAASTQFDGNATLLISNKYWVGLSYRLQDAIVAMAGLEIIPNLKLGYAYDLTTSDIKTYSSGTHEIMLNYCFKPIKIVKRQFHRNVRFL
jgi:type IX secretion system PorP/SprF family membrane protein